MGKKTLWTQFNFSWEGFGSGSVNCEVNVKMSLG